MVYRHSVIAAAALFLTLIPIQTTAKLSTVAVFRREELELHKYSAVLAEIEPFRLLLNEDIRNALNPISYIFHKIKGTDFEILKNSKNNKNVGLKIAYIRYESKIKQIARAYDMNVQTFNNLSNQISMDLSLKNKVLLQAYYYRISTDLDSNIRKIPLKISDSVDVNKVQNNGFEVAADRKESKNNLLKIDNEFHNFCKTLHMIESERKKRREILMTELGINRLPDNMCRPDVFPTMSKQVKEACRDFHIIVKKVIEYNGFENENFYNMYEKANENLIFNTRVKYEINKIKKEQKQFVFNTNS